MGIYDRDYYRREGPSFLETIANTGRVCKWLILLNVLLFVLQLATKPTEPVLINRYGAVLLSQGPVTDALCLDTGAVLHGEVWRLLTHAFLHDVRSLWHIVFNMLFLWWFGRELEELYGSWEFLAFYLTAAVVGGLAFLLGNLTGFNGPLALGASGAVTAVMVLFALHYPTRTVLLFFLVPVPVWLLVAFQVAQDIFGFLGGRPGIGWSAHLGGAAFGLLYYKLHWRLTSFLPSLRSWQRNRSRPRLRIYREEDTPTPVPAGGPASSPDVDEHLEAKMDAVLEKLSRHGKDSLTESERQILLRASEKIRERRRT